jgi:hypothetical protein
VASAQLCEEGSNPQHPGPKPSVLPLNYRRMEPVKGIEPSSPDWKSGATTTELHRHGADDENRTRYSTLARLYVNQYTTSTCEHSAGLEPT